MRIFISFGALFLSVILLQLSSGGMAPLDALSGSAMGFSTSQIGMLGSAHFFGFLLGSWWAPRLMGAIGHSRAFAAYTAAGAIGAIGHTLSEDPNIWALLRILTGLCVAGCYTVIESWLNAKLTNSIRGRVFGVYRVADLSASMSAQLLIGVLTPAAYSSYNILAILCCAAIFPLTLTTSRQPQTGALPRMRPIKTMRISPLASSGVLVAGITSSAFRMVGPVYAQGAGFSPKQIAFFLFLTILGGALAQFPIGWLADKFPRRNVLFWLSIGSIFVSWGVVASPMAGTQMIFAASFLFGLLTFPIFSVASALAYDFAETEDMVGIAASLMFIYAVGAIGAPYFSALLMQQFGASALFVFISVVHLGLALFGLYRMRVREAPASRERYVYWPRTSLIIGKLGLRSPRNKRSGASETPRRGNNTSPK